MKVPEGMEYVGGRPKITISASQIKTHEECARLWGAQRSPAFRLPRLPRALFKDGSVFGTILHGVVERYYKADHLGRDEEGNPVELYPENWHFTEPGYKPETFVQRWLLPTEQIHLKKVVAKAIEERIIAREIGGVVEKRIDIQVLKSSKDECPHCQSERISVFKQPGKSDRLKCLKCQRKFPLLPAVWLMGFIDYDLPAKVLDHKTSKAKKYFLGKKRLAKDIQMNTYGYAKLLENPDLEEVEFVHTQFLTDLTSPLVKSTSVTVSAERIRSVWHSRVIPAAHQMRERRGETRLKELPMARNPRRCNDYGGCELQGICHRSDTPEKYKERAAGLVRNLRLDAQKSYKKLLASQGESIETTQPNKESRVAKLSVKQNLAKMKARRARLKEAKEGSSAAPAWNAPAAAKVPVKKKPKAKAKPAPPEAPEGEARPAAPWHDPTCASCANSPVLGTSYKDGKPCRICAIRAKKNGGPNPVDYTCELHGDMLLILNNEDPEEAYEFAWGPPAESGNKPKKKKKAKAKPKPKPKAPEPEPEPEPEEEEAPEEEEEEIPTSEEVEGEEDKEDKAAARKLRRKTRAQKPKPGRPAATFSLYINCMPDKHSKLRTVASLVALWGQELADISDQSSFYQMDPFKRSDALAALAAEMIEGLKGTTIISANNTLDEKRVTSVLESYASTIVRALA